MGHAGAVTRGVRYTGFRPASPTASSVARSASGKSNTGPELALRRALWRAGLRGYRVDERRLAGRPDVVFPRARVAIFVDGDFWHGRDLEQRVERLARGHNAPYWVPKIRGNVARDRRHDDQLAADGWLVLRFWETDIARDIEAIAGKVERVVRTRLRAAEGLQAKSSVSRD